jgi:predicted aldo/keto reductase-like oxidoreductase
MQYRELGKKGFKASILGFGGMRLPLIRMVNKNIDEKESERLVLYAIENGVNYFDTAYSYHEGTGERVLGSILKRNKCREKIALATKMPCWLVHNYGDFDRFFNEQLERLQTDHIDFYLLHSLYSETWRTCRDLRVLDWVEKALHDGKIGEIGFSFHDGFGVFKQIIDAYDSWSFCQIQYNYINENVQAGVQGLHYAHDRKIPVIVMEPLLGGLLANPPQDIKRVFEERRTDPVAFAFHWLYGQPEIATVLSGMTTMDMLKQNIRIADTYETGAATDREFLALVQEKYKEYHKIPCTKCNYCMPCPHEVDIPKMFELYNQSMVKPAHDGHNRVHFIRDYFFNMSKYHYKYHTPYTHRASACTGCRMCESKCPQKIRISEHMPEIDKRLSYVVKPERR